MDKPRSCCSELAQSPAWGHSSAPESNECPRTGGEPCPGSLGWRVTPANPHEAEHSATLCEAQSIPQLSQERCSSCSRCAQRS